MPNEYERILDELRDAGVQDSYITDLEKMLSASPIRKERDEFKQQAEAALAEVNRYRTATLSATFKEVGITGKPEKYNIPADLDVTDMNAVRDWAVDGGLVPPPQAVTPEEQAAHERIANASDGASPTTPSTARDEILQAGTAEEFFAKAKAAGVFT